LGKSKLKRILTMVDGGFNMDKIHDMDRYVNLINNEIDMVVVETEKQGKLARSIGIDIPINIIPFGVDTDIYKPQPIPSHPFKFLFASSPIKKNQLESRGIDLMLRALAKVQGNIRLTYITREGLSNEIKGLISKYKLESRIDLLTGDQKMPDLYSKHHACIIPYTSHFGVMDLPHTALESLASGRPVVSTDVIGLGQILSDNNCGIACSPTLDEFLKAMNRIKDLYPTFQENCEGTAEKLFKKDQFLLRYKKLYTEVINA
jgi:glycosyltransferase involved in cell wall biosynthesis